MFWGNQGHDEQQTNQEQGNNQINNTEYYQLLQVTKDTPVEQIRKAFRKKALKQHPDKGGDPQKFKRISQAYQVLTNPEKKQLYDQWGEQGVKNGGPPNSQGMGGFSNIFNRKDSGPRKMKSKLVEIQVTLEEIFVGVMKKIEVQRYRICEQCDGKGGKNPQKCEECKGVGVTLQTVRVMGMLAQTQVSCSKCQGKGQTLQQQDKCKTCETKKVVQKSATIEVAIQQGCPDLHDYILTGEADDYPGVLAGDVYARIKIKQHEIFIRKGADLTLIKKISLLEALTGICFTIKHLDGKEYTVATAPGQILGNKVIKTIKKLGMPFYKDSMSYGNLHVEFLVDFPDAATINQQQRETIQKILSKVWADRLKENQCERSKDENLNKNIQEYSEECVNKSPNYPRGHENQSDEEGQEGNVQQQVQCGNQ